MIVLARIADFIGRVSDRRWSAILFSLGIAVIFGFVDCLVGLTSLGAGLNPVLQTKAQAALVGAVAGMLSLLLLAARREQRRIVRDELTRVAELNHRLRNALQVIRYANHLDPAHGDAMVEAVDSIEVALRQLFPSTGTERRRDSRVQEEVL